MTGELLNWRFPMRAHAICWTAALSIGLSGCPSAPMGTSCADDGDCPSGQYCDDDLQCNLDCREDTDCGGGATCSSRGRCEAATDAGTPDAGATPDSGGMCRNDADCRDASFCNGEERCAPGEAGAGPNGCVSGSAPCPLPDCDEAGDACRSSCDEDADGNGRLDADNDGDGHRSIACGSSGSIPGDDCDDADADRFPRSLAEICDPLAPDHDEDCNPCTVASYVASDGDRDGDRYFAVACSNPLLDSDDPATFSCPVSVRDFVAVVRDAPTPMVTGTDCNDEPGAGASIHPTEAELCNGINDDCDTMTDEGVSETVYADCDGDGWGETGDGMLGCHGAALPADHSCTAGGQYVRGRMLDMGGTLAFDCNGADATVNPMASDGCPIDDDIDNDCDGAFDETGSETVFPDCDHDGWPRGTGSVMGCSGAPLPDSVRTSLGCVSASTWLRPTAIPDCNDANGTIFPMAMESCNSVNDDCDAGTDEGLRDNLYFDGDGDGYGAGAITSVCRGTARYVANSTDCNDAIGAVNPGATEVCNGRDDNCDGRPDTDLALGLMRYAYRDWDGDGYGGGAVELVCVTTPGYSTNSGDCRDSDARVFQTATVRLDQDADGYCIAAATYSACVGPRAGNLYTHAWVFAGGVDSYYSSVREPSSCLGDECYGSEWFGSDRNAHAPAARGCRYEITGSARGCGCGVGCCTCTPSDTYTCDPGYQPSTTPGYDRCFRTITSGGGNCSAGTRSVSGRNATCSLTQTCNGLEGTTCRSSIFCSPCNATGC